MPNPPKYRGKTKAHPWVVVVERRTPHVTFFRMVHGPARTRTRVHKLLNAIFDRDFERISGKDPL